MPTCGVQNCQFDLGEVGRMVGKCCSVVGSPEGNWGNAQDQGLPVAKVQKNESGQ